MKGVLALKSFCARYAAASAAEMALSYPSAAARSARGSGLGFGLTLALSLGRRQVCLLARGWATIRVLGL